MCVFDVSSQWLSSIIKPGESSEPLKGARNQSGLLPPSLPRCLLCDCWSASRPPSVGFNSQLQKEKEGTDQASDERDEEDEEEERRGGGRKELKKNNERPSSSPS